MQVSYLLPYENRPTAILHAALFDHGASAFTRRKSAASLFADAPFAPGQPLQLQDGVYNTFDLQGSIPANTPFTFSLKGQAGSIGQIAARLSPLSCF